MLDPSASSSSASPMTAFSPISADQTVPSTGQLQADTKPHFDSNLDQLGQHFLLVADAANKFSVALQQTLRYLA